MIKFGEAECRGYETPCTYSPWNSPGQNTGVGSLSLLQRIFLTHGSNPGLPRCRRILYQLNHKGSHKEDVVHIYNGIQLSHKKEKNSSIWRHMNRPCCCSVAKSRLNLCNLMDCSTPEFPVHHQPPELAQTPVHQVGDAIHPFHPLSSSPSPFAFNLFQHQSLF